MNMKIVADSSCDIYSLEHVDFKPVPLHIIVGDKDFIDDNALDINEMQNALDAHKNRTSTSCPGPAEWMSAFGEAEVIFCVTITGQLSGSNNSAVIAKKMYEEEYPGRRVHVLDSLSTGPEVTLIIEKLQELILSGLSHEEILKKIVIYMIHTHLYFSLSTLNNLARNGRVNPLLAKGIGMLGIRVIGRASDEGTLQTIDKSRGDKRAVLSLVKHMDKCGYTNGKIIIAHNNNLSAATALKHKIEHTFGEFNGYIHTCGGLDSYYAEPGSVLIGFEA